MSDSEYTDEKFEEFLRREARAWNAPGSEVPRDAMWDAIQSARAETRPASMPVTAEAAALRRRRITWAWVGMAATLVIGVAIGKYAFGTRAAADGASPQFAAGDSAGTSYSVAATDHLARAEALLTAFGTSTTDAASDAQLSGWARDVLSNTRLLLDSPAARDPVHRQLLEDLELVLVQIVQRSPAAGRAEERSHITHTLRRTQVLARLRSSRSFGPNSGT